MKVTVVGSGSNLVSPERYGSCYLVEADHKTILFDIGIHSSLRLQELGLSLADIDILLISHRHSDHIGDLMSSLISTHQVGLRGLGPKRTKPLTIHGYPGLQEDYKALRQMMFPDKAETYEITTTEHDDEEFSIGGIKVNTRLVPHMEQFMKAIGVRLEADGQILAYSGDTGKSDVLVELAKNCDVFVAEASFPSSQFESKGSVYGHMAPQEAAQIAQAAGAKKLVLSHINTGEESENTILKAAKQYFQGEVLVARDKAVIL